MSPLEGEAMVEDVSVTVTGPFKPVWGGGEENEGEDVDEDELLRTQHLGTKDEEHQHTLR